MAGGDTGEMASGASVPCETLTAGHLFFLLHHLVRQRENALGLELARSGLTLGQWQVLATLNRLDRATMGEAAAFCAADRTTLTRTVDRMVKDGLVERDRRPADRRQVQLNLTEKGDAVYRSALIEVTRFNDRVTGGLTAEEAERLESMIGRMLVEVRGDAGWVQDLRAFRRLKAERSRT